MVENLTEKNLNLEETVAQLAEGVADLEALQDINDQLQESAKELEMELREELQQSQITTQNVYYITLATMHANNGLGVPKIRENNLKLQVFREREALLETIADRDATILRFRELVQKLRDENELLRRNLEEESSKSIPGLPEALDFKVSP